VGGIEELRRDLTFDLAAAKAWEGGLYQNVDLRPLLPRISAPTLVLAGELDLICGPAQARRIAETVRTAEVVLIPDCGHLLAVEDPAAYAKAVVDWVRIAVSILVPTHHGFDDLASGGKSLLRREPHKGRIEFLGTARLPEEIDRRSLIISLPALLVEIGQNLTCFALHIAKCRLWCVEECCLIDPPKPFSQIASQEDD
jgi:hypothetical protein